MGDKKYIDTMIRDGLWDAFNGYHMGQTAENVAEKWQISRDMQDEFAVASQNKAEAAQKAGKFDDEVIPFTIKTRKGDIVMDKDEYIRHGATMEAMQKLRPAFTKDGSVTAANASGINDGAAGALLMSADEAEKRGIEPLARIASYATAGLDPTIMGVGPIYASRRRWKSGLESRGSGPGRSERSVCQVCREQRHGLEPRNRERQRRIARPPDRCLGRADLNTLLFKESRDAKKGLATFASAAWASRCAWSARKCPINRNIRGTITVPPFYLKVVRTSETTP